MARTVEAATCVRAPVRFVMRELTGRATTAVYPLRGSPLRAAIRHPLMDMWVLDEIFRNGAYVLPPAVRARLDAVGHPLRVLDLGGHVGLFGLWFRLHFPDAEVTSYEPDPENVAALRRCVTANGLVDRWRVVEAAAATNDGVATFASGGALSQLGGVSDRLRAEHAVLAEIFPFLRGRRLLTPRDVAVRTVDVMPDLAASDFVKIDIQGGEWPLLTDDRFEHLRAVGLVVELHPDAAPVEEPLAWTTALLEGLGFSLEVMPAHGRERIIWATRS